MVKLGIYGARGRMGQELCIASENNQNAVLSYLFEREDHPDMGKNNFNLIVGSSIHELLSESDVVIDFTSPEATGKLLSANEKFKKPLVIGTTGLNQEQIKNIENYSKFFPIVFSPNYSIGVNLLIEVMDMVGKVLSKDKGYDLEIIELHHRFKKDAPSGTALKLAEAAAKATGRNLSKDAVYGREGITGERNPDEVGVFAVRAGDIVGEHTVLFTTLGERVEITHKAHSRQTFAKGAVEAAVWIQGKANRVYTMKDVLGF
ncbi:MAG TPA: 4-hydroxy-tetrahydrodipicolinate reductase [Spirochaetia bacterium]|nr:MAG: 4-hydroxy-tetrahydrodipicolinate reductase [Spirochaetes bacterium GWB1_36_13]HCL56749.1 4-hydroxy-tetrahydrodipicolinate reductase [Spirochaetia bacterium]